VKADLVAAIEAYNATFAAGAPSLAGGGSGRAAPATVGA
jgi:hypothetical protein